MKTARIWITTTLLLTAASLCLQAQTADIAEPSIDDRACSNGSVAGAWAFTETGTFIPTTGAAPFAAVASYALDSNNNLVGTATSSLGGTVSEFTLQGSGVVNSDCTGTLSINVYKSGTLVRTANFNIVYIHNSRAARALNTSVILADGTSVPTVVTFDSQKVFDGLRHP